MTEIFFFCTVIFIIIVASSFWSSIAVTKSDVILFQDLKINIVVSFVVSYLRSSSFVIILSAIFFWDFKTKIVVFLTDRWDFSDKQLNFLLEVKIIDVSIREDRMSLSRCNLNWFFSEKLITTDNKMKTTYIVELINIKN